jgi:hypothetical protein
MELLLDFVNIRKWNRKAFFGFGKKHGFDVISSSPMVLDMLKHYLYKEGKYDHEQFLDFLDEDNRRIYPKCVCAQESVTREQLNKNPINYHRDIVMPDDRRALWLFFMYLDGLSSFWRWLVEDTQKHGPHIITLNYFLEDVELSFQETESVWAPQLAPPEKKTTYIELKLGAAYLAPFFHGDGEAYKRIRTCSDPDCGRLFIYNRPKQTFCNNDCRFHFHNVVKTRNGYMAEHQRRGRKENPAIYVRK